MYTVVREDDLRTGSSRTATFEGARHGSGVSFFHMDCDPGRGPELHAHPYSETWVVLSGEATIRVDGVDVAAGPGDVVVAVANTPHRFWNSGSERLELMCIHAAPEFETTWLEEADEATA
jgi:mannose-6-phosphate isomerase-like protein (cupin superfamily)